MMSVLNGEESPAHNVAPVAQEHHNARANIMKITPIQFNEVNQAALLLSRSFNGYPMHEWIFNDEFNKNEILLKLNTACLKHSIMYGMALKIEPFETIILVQKPGYTGK